VSADTSLEEMLEKFSTVVAIQIQAKPKMFLLLNGSSAAMLVPSSGIKQQFTSLFQSSPPSLMALEAELKKI
jgi:hypothetical protein